MRREYGSITTVKHGVQRVRYWADLHDGKGYTRRSKTIRGSKRDAAAWLAQQHVNHGSDSPTMTLGGIYDTWYKPDIDSRLKPRTLYVYEQCWLNTISPKWAKVQPQDVRPAKVQEWLLTLTPSTAKAALKILAPLGDLAVQYELHDTNPFRLKYRKPTDIAKQDAGIYTLAECRKLASAAEGLEIEAALILMAFGSCRVGEALGANASDVDIYQAQNGMACAAVRVCRQVDLHGQVVESVKNYQSERYVIIPEPWSLRIRDIATGQPWLSGCYRTLPRKDVMREWRYVCKQVGLPCHPLKNLRPSWRTYMSAELAANPETLEKLMGHKGKSVTDRHYYRPEILALMDEVANVFAAQ